MRMYLCVCVRCSSSILAGAFAVEAGGLCSCRCCKNWRGIASMGKRGLV